MSYCHFTNGLAEVQNSLKGIVHPNMKTLYLLTLVLMDGWVKFFSPQNTAGVSQDQGLAVMSQTTEANGD